MARYRRQSLSTSSHPVVLLESFILVLCVCYFYDDKKFKVINSKKKKFSFIKHETLSSTKPYLS